MDAVVDNPDGLLADEIVCDVNSGLVVVTVVGVVCAAVVGNC